MITVATAKISMKIIYDNDAHKYIDFIHTKQSLIPILSLLFLLSSQKVYMSRYTPEYEKHMTRM